MGLSSMVSWCRHLLVPLYSLFHDIPTSPFPTCSTRFWQSRNFCPSHARTRTTDNTPYAYAQPSAVSQCRHRDSLFRAQRKPLLFHFIEQHKEMEPNYVCHKIYIRASVDALCRDGTSEISRDPRTKRLQTRRESLAMPSKHTNNNF